MIRIVAPEYTPGRSTFLDVDFLDGVAEVDELHPVRAQALEQHGYVLTDEVGEVPSEDEVGGTAIVNLNDLTVPELRGLIGDRAEIPAKARKPELVAIAAALPPLPTEAERADIEDHLAATGIVEPTAADVENVHALASSPGIPSLLSEAGEAGAHDDFTEPSRDDVVAALTSD